MFGKRCGAHDSTQHTSSDPALVWPFFRSGSVSSEKCEGGVDVVGVVTPFVRGGAQVLHDDRVVELSVLLEVQEREEEREDGEGQIEVEGEDELKEKRSCMTMNVDEMRLKNTLCHEVHVR